MMSSSKGGVRLSIIKAVSVDSASCGKACFFIPRGMLSRVCPRGGGFGARFIVGTSMGRLPTTRGIILGTVNSGPSVRFGDFSSTLSSVGVRVAKCRVPVCKLVIFVTVFNVVGLYGALVAGLMSERRRFKMLRSVNLSGGRLCGVLEVRYLCCIFKAVTVAFIFNATTNCVLYRVFGRIKIFKGLRCAFPFLRILLFFTILMMVTLVCSALTVHCYRGRSLMSHVGAVR